MKFGKFFVIAAILGIAVGASAQTTVYSGNIFDWVISDPVAVGDGSENLCMVILSIVNNTGDANNNPQAFDSKASGYSGISSPSDRLHQEHSAVMGGAGETPVNDTPLSTAIDTHFLLYNVNHAFDSGSGAPEEGYYPMTNSAEAETTGGALGPLVDTSFGSFLTATFTLTGAVGNTMQLAQIVTPSNPISVQAQVATSLGVKDDTAQFTFTPDCVIPTPAALPMGLVGLALIRRRR